VITDDYGPLGYIYFSLRMNVFIIYVLIERYFGVCALIKLRVIFAAKNSRKCLPISREFIHYSCLDKQCVLCLELFGAVERSSD